MEKKERKMDQQRDEDLFGEKQGLFESKQHTYSNAV